MNLNRKHFLAAIMGLMATPWALSLGLMKRRTGAAPAVEPWLAHWRQLPRHPHWDICDSAAASFIDAALRGETIEFYYDGGATPGQRRKISPGLIFSVEDGGELYVSGYCHERQEERVFRLDRITMVNPDDENDGRPHPSSFSNHGAERCPLAAGLSDADIAQLLHLVRTITSEEVLSLHSEHEHARIETGFLGDGTCGAGTSIACQRTAAGWKIQSTSEWIA
jgi:hypothetical protein